MQNAPIAFAAGQSFRTRARSGVEPIVTVGAVLRFAEGRTIVACAVSDAEAGRGDGAGAPVVIPFLAFTAEALAASIEGPAPVSPLPDAFGAAFEAWQSDPRGFSYFTVPFDGSLDRLIAAQMAVIAGQS